MPPSDRTPAEMAEIRKKVKEMLAKTTRELAFEMVTGAKAKTPATGYGAPGTFSGMRALLDTIAKENPTPYGEVVVIPMVTMHAGPRGGSRIAPPPMYEDHHVMSLGNGMGIDLQDGSIRRLRYTK